jgi:replicative DNA helicase
MTGIELEGVQLPHSIDAEQAILASLVVDPSGMDDLQLSRDDFYIPEHAEIFTAIQKLYAESRTVDVATLIDKLTTSGVYDDSGGREYITHLVREIPAVAGCSEYARIIKNHAAMRRIICAADEIREAALHGGDAQSVVALAESKIYGITDEKAKSGFVDIGTGILTMFQNLHDLSEKPDQYRGLQTGFDALDSVIIGMNKSDLVLVGARPGMGKTALAMNIATNAAKNGKTVAVFSLEMSADQLISRIMASEAQVPSHFLRTGNIQDWVPLAHASSCMAETKLVIDDTPGLSVSQIKSRLRRVKDLGLVVIDYLQLMQSDTTTGNRVQEVGEISRGLKLLAKELSVPVICCAQLSRSPESRPDKRPMLSDLRESGSIEQDADIVLFLYREDYYKDESPEQSVAEVIVAKNRHGSVGKVKLGWIGSYTKFVNLPGTP